jgi:hypothetical protein
MKKKSERPTHQKEFEYIKDTFFPRWRSGEKWKLRLSKSAHYIGHGICDDEKKTIVVASFLSGTELQKTVIHEICHAVTHNNHGNKFLTRMEKASDKAKALGLGELSKSILADIECYKSHSIKLSAPKIYDSIQDLVYAKPGASYRQIVEAVGRYWGVSFRELKRYFEMQEDL